MGDILDFPPKAEAGFLVCPECRHFVDDVELDADWGAVIRYDSNGFPFVAALVCAACGHEIILINGYLEED